MRILYHHRTRGGDTGAQGVHIKEMIKAFKKLGHQVDCIALYGTIRTSKDAQNRIWLQNFLKAIWAWLRNYSPEIIFELFEIAYNIVGYTMISKQLKKEKYDFIYERYSLFCLAGVICAQRYKIPIILEVNYTSTTRFCRPISKAFKKLTFWFDFLLFKKVHGIVVVSTFLKEHLIKDFKVDEKKIIITTNAADPAVFSPDISLDMMKKRFNLSSEKIVGFVGSFLPWHGVDKFVLEVIPKVIKKVYNVRFLLIGDGHMKKDIEGKILDSGLKDYIILANAVPHEVLPSYIAIFDIAVLPNSNNHGSPMKIFEYMSMSKPVIAPAVRPVKEVIADGENGILFQPNNYSELANHIIRLLGDDDLCKRIGVNARKKILKDHTWEKNAQKVIRLYNTIVR